MQQRRRRHRVAQLVGSCAVLGVGIGLILTARLGSDGYSSLINGVVRASGAPYALVNLVIGATLVLVARVRGVHPGVGTFAHPVVVGSTVNVVLECLGTPPSLLGRISLLAIGALVLAVGITGYLDARLGSGPLEAATFALHPIPFGFAYNGLQALGALSGWALGADLGIGTLVVVLGIGPLVHALRRRIDERRSQRGQRPT